MQALRGARMQPECSSDRLSAPSLLMAHLLAILWDQLQQ